MMVKKWEGTSEDFLIKQGWKKIKGWKINLETLSDYDHFDTLYVEDLSDYAEECEYWQGNESHPESAFEDANEAIEKCFEDYFDDQDNLYDEKVTE